MANRILSHVHPQPQDVFNHFARMSADQQLGVVLEFPCRLDEGRLKNSVTALCRAQPVLGCRFIYNSGRPRFIPGQNDDSFSIANSPDVHAAAMDAAAQPLDYSDTGVFHVGLIRGPASDAIAMRIDHTAADGQGAK